jgi:hypothetical protein
MKVLVCQGSVFVALNQKMNYKPCKSNAIGNAIFINSKHTCKITIKGFDVTIVEAVCQTPKIAEINIEFVLRFLAL